MCLTRQAANAKRISTPAEKSKPVPGAVHAWSAVAKLSSASSCLVRTGPFSGWCPLCCSSTMEADEDANRQTETLCHNLSDGMTRWQRLSRSGTLVRSCPAGSLESNRIIYDQSLLGGTFALRKLPSACHIQLFFFSWADGTPQAF